jgi:hypothetical protein
MAALRTRCRRNERPAPSPRAPHPRPVCPVPAAACPALVRACLRAVGMGKGIVSRPVLVRDRACRHQVCRLTAKPLSSDKDRGVVVYGLKGAAGGAYFTSVKSASTTSSSFLPPFA